MGHENTTARGAWTGWTACAAALCLGLALVGRALWSPQMVDTVLFDLAAVVCSGLAAFALSRQREEAPKKESKDLELLLQRVLHLEERLKRMDRETATGFRGTPLVSASLGDSTSGHTVRRGLKQPDPSLLPSEEAWPAPKVGGDRKAAYLTRQRPAGDHSSLTC